MKAKQQGQRKYDSDSPSGADEWPDFAETETAGVQSAIREPSIDELLEEADERSQQRKEELAAESDFTETGNLDFAEELLAPEEMFSSEDLKGKI